MEADRGGFSAAGEYHARDFDWAEHARETALAREAAAAAAPARRPDGGGDGASEEEEGPGCSPAGAWERFHRVQNGRAKFFEQRRYLMREFPGLLGARRVLELGCGSGSTAIPVASENRGCEILAVDFAEASVTQLQGAARELGLSPPRVRATVCDAAAMPCPEPLRGLGADACLMVFLLSAVEPARWPDVLANAFEALCPGGRVYFRDYGLHDSAQIKWPPAQQSSNPGPGGTGAGPTYWRQDGTLSHFFEVSHLVRLFKASGFLAVEAEYVCVHARNRKKGTLTRRVFVHGVFERSPAADPPERPL